MAVLTQKGREIAVKMLWERRKENKKKKRINNSSLRAGDPMYFYCVTCNAELIVPEDYIDKPELCEECGALKVCGWLE